MELRDYEVGFLAGPAFLPVANGDGIPEYRQSRLCRQLQALFQNRHTCLQQSSATGSRVEEIQSWLCDGAEGEAVCGAGAQLLQCGQMFCGAVAFV